jgi:hypothetical protein
MSELTQRLSAQKFTIACTRSCRLTGLQLHPVSILTGCLTFHSIEFVFSTVLTSAECQNHEKGFPWMGRPSVKWWHHVHGKLLPSTCSKWWFCGAFVHRSWSRSFCQHLCPNVFANVFCAGQSRSYIVLRVYVRVRMRCQLLFSRLQPSRS